MDTKRSSRRALLTLGLAMALVISLLTGVASAGKTPTPSPASVTWTGNGSVLTGTTRTLKTVICDASNTPYLLWVLSGSKATSASIAIPGQSAQSMGKPQVDKLGFSTFKYTWSPGSAINLNTLYNTVTATYNDAKNKATLTVSHGCLGSGGGGTTTTTSTTSTSTSTSSTTTSTSTTSSTTTSTSTTTTTAPALCGAAPTLQTEGDPGTSYDNDRGGWEVSNGNWNAIPNCTNAFTYQWQYTVDPPFRPEGQRWVDYPDQTTNFLSEADSEPPGVCVQYVRAVVTATNAFGSTSAYSDLIELCS